ncbi:class I SAM-dependent methyltransferase [Candidatus Tisiphia endosymbiont of Temnostethus pusillus]|uniref:class I SAM-dependent methyltransferase n=1 Tax=Candidatus Tisiphia endosymbiont of Temnostethus pusillus TaxID=3139335 RepID=UPI0035C8C9F7
MRTYFNLFISLTLNLVIFNIPAYASSHWDAELYKKNSVKLQQFTALEVISKVKFKGTEHILDIGCGDGKITKILAERVPYGKVLGIDISESMIKLAHQLQTENLHFSISNSERLLTKEKFDLIFSFFCIQWVENKQQAFYEISNHLGERGKVYLIMTNRNPHLLAGRKNIFNSIKWNVFYKDYKDTTDVIDNDDYLTYATQAGLKNVKFKKFVRRIDFDSYEELKTFITMVTPSINILPNEQLKQEFIKELVAYYLNDINPINASTNYIEYEIYQVHTSNNETLGLETFDCPILGSEA